MQILSVLLFAVSCNLDNFAVGISYGVKKIRVPFLSNFTIALITLLGTLMSMFSGKALAVFIPREVTDTLGCFILMGIGLFGIIKYIYGRKRESESEETLRPLKNDEKYDKNNNKKIELNEAVVLGFALSINNIGLGVGASIGGLQILSTAVSSFILSMVFIFLGNLLGQGIFSKFVGQYAELIASVIIIALGIWELIF